MRIAMFDGYREGDAVSAALSARRRRLAGFGDAIGDFINSRVSAMVELNDALYSSLNTWRIGAAIGSTIPGSRGFTPSFSEVATMESAVTSWHNAAKAWMDAANRAAVDSSFISQWKSTGATIARHGRDLAKSFGDYGLAARFEAALAMISEGITDALWAIGKPLVLVLGIALGVVILVKKV